MHDFMILHIIKGKSKLISKEAGLDCPKGRIVPYSVYTKFKKNRLLIIHFVISEVAVGKRISKLCNESIVTNRLSLYFVKLEKV